MTIPSRGAARVDSAGKVVQLGAKPAPDEVVSQEDAKDVVKLAKLLTRILATLATLRRTWVPRTMTFNDVLTTATPATRIRLQHNFGGRVNWWVCDFQISGASTTPQIHRIDAECDANTLVLSSYTTSRISVRVEECG